MAQIIGLPKLSPTMEEGVLVKWVKTEGDAVSPGDLVAEVETDKANMDFNLEDEGVLLKLLVSEGDTVKLGAPVAILGQEGEDIAGLIEEARAQMSGGAGPETKGLSAEDVADKDAGTRQAAPAQATPEAQAAAQRAAAPASAPAPSPAQAPAPAAPAGRVLASPLAKTLALELGVDIRTLQGTGPGSRVVERDVRAAASQRGAAPAPAAPTAVGYASPAAAAPAPVVTEPPSRVVVTAGEEYRDEPLSSMRKRIAQRLTEAKRDVPHFYLTRTIDAAPLLDFRKRLNDLLGDRGKVSVNDLVIKGVALALRRMPSCNAAFLGEDIRYFQRVHVGVAVAIEQGLVTPVIRDADLKGIGAIAAEVRDLAQRARDRRLKVEEIQGSTFTVSNLGMFGVDHFQAIINPPEAGILAVGAVTDQPVVKDGQIVPGKRMTMTMSCDHRVIDGALGARYLQELTELLEHPESLAL